MLIGGSERAFAIEPANPNVMHAWILPILVDGQISFGKPIRDRIQPLGQFFVNILIQLNYSSDLLLSTYGYHIIQYVFGTSVFMTCGRNQISTSNSPR
jgi:hypothetical protein